MKPSCRSGGRAATMSLAAILAVMPLSAFMRYACTLARKETQDLASLERQDKNGRMLTATMDLIWFDCAIPRK